MIQDAGVAGEEEGGVGDVLGLAEALERDVWPRRRPRRAPTARGEVGLDQAGGEGVHADAGGELGGERLGQMDESRPSSTL